MVYADGVEVVHEDFCRGNAVRFEGEKGILSVSREFLDSDPANIVSATIGKNETHLYKSSHHQQDWIDAIKNNSLPVCDVEIGHRSASICHIANIAYELNRPLIWNPQQEAFVGNDSTTKFFKPTPAWEKVGIDQGRMKWAHGCWTHPTVPVLSLIHI